MFGASKLLYQCLLPIGGMQADADSEDNYDCYTHDKQHCNTTGSICQLTVFM